MFQKFIFSVNTNSNFTFFLWNVPGSLFGKSIVFFGEVVYNFYFAKIKENSSYFYKMNQNFSYFIEYYVILDFLYDAARISFLGECKRFLEISISW